MICISDVDNLRYVAKLIKTAEANGFNDYIKSDGVHPSCIIYLLKDASIKQKSIVAIETTKQEFILRNYLISKINRHHLSKIILKKIEESFEKIEVKETSIPRINVTRSMVDEMLLTSDPIDIPIGESTLTPGSGVETTLTSGGGVETTLTPGGDVETTLTQMGGQSILEQGGSKICELIDINESPDSKLEKFKPSCPIDFDEKNIFNYKLFDNNINIQINTKQTSYLYKTLSPLWFGKYFKKDNNFEAIEKLNLNILRHTAITSKKITSIFDAFVAQDFVILIDTFLKRYTDLKKLKQLKCGIETSLNTLKKILIKFAKTFFPRKLYTNQIDYNRKVYENTISPYEREKSNIIKRKYSVRIVDELKVIMNKFHQLLQKTFKTNVKKNLNDYTILIKILLGSKTVIDSHDVLKSILGLNSTQNVDFNIITKRDLFINEISYTNFVRTLNEVKNSPSYNYFHALADLFRINEKKIKKYVEYKKLIEQFFNISNVDIRQYSCQSFQRIGFEKFKQYEVKRMLKKLVNRFSKICKSEKKCEKMLRLINDI